MREDDLYALFVKISDHPITYGFFAGVVRYLVGDRTAGWKALVTNITLSMFIAFLSTMYLMDESYSSSKKIFFTIIASLLARDLLVALLAIGQQIQTDPLGFVGRIKEALKGATK